jgi:hypothetical protein
MNNAVGNVLFLFLTKDLFLSACFCHNFSVVNQRPTNAIGNPRGASQPNNGLFLARGLLLSDGRAPRTLSRSSIGMSSLPTYGECSAMSQTAITTDVHQPLDVHLNPFPQIALDLTLGLENGTNSAQLIFIQVFNSGIEIHSRFP